MSRADDRGDQPRAMIHRRILDVAASQPDASLDALADEVSAASPSLVERVLEEYGDPASDGDGDGDGVSGQGSDSLPSERAGDAEHAERQSEQPQAGPQQPMGTTETEPKPEEPGERSIAKGSLSTRQRRTLHEVFERPDASQGEIAESLDVTRATVSRRLNSIPGFEWENRRSVAQSVFGVDSPEESERPHASPETDAGETADEADAADAAPDASESAAETGDGTTNADELANGGRSEATDGDGVGGVGRPSDRSGGDVAPVKADSDPDPNRDAADDVVATFSLSPELANKVLQACAASDQITEEEEVTVVRSLARN